MGEIVNGNNQGWHKVDNSPEGAEEVAGLAQGLFDVRHFVGKLGVELNDADHAEEAGFFDAAALLWFHLLTHGGGFFGGIGNGVFGFVDTQGGEGSGTADGVSGVGIAVVEGTIFFPEIREGIIEHILNNTGA